VTQFFDVFVEFFTHLVVSRSVCTEVLGTRMRLGLVLFIIDLLYDGGRTPRQILGLRAAPIAAASALDDSVSAQLVVFDARVLDPVLRSLHHFSHSDDFLIANDVRWQIATVYINNLIAFVKFKVIQAVSINVEKHAFSTLVVVIEVISDVSQSFIRCRLCRCSLCKEFWW